MSLTNKQKLEKKICECGCGEQILRYNKRGKENRYKIYHKAIMYGHSCKGKHLSEQHKLKISVGNKGKRGVYIEADHIKPFAFYPELRFDINNGRTLCRDCHKKTNTYNYRFSKIDENTR